MERILLIKLGKRDIQTEELAIGVWGLGLGARGFSGAKTTRGFRPNNGIAVLCKWQCQAMVASVQPIMLGIYTIYNIHIIYICIWNRRLSPSPSA